MGSVALVNARVLAGESLRRDVAVLIDGGRIAALLPEPQARAQAAETVDLEGGILLPGFIDVQVNGGGGVLFNNAPTVEALRTIVAGHRRLGLHLCGAGL